MKQPLLNIQSANSASAKSDAPPQSDNDTTPTTSETPPSNSHTRAASQPPKNIHQHLHPDRDPYSTYQLDWAQLRFRYNAIEQHIQHPGRSLPPSARNSVIIDRTNSFRNSNNNPRSRTMRQSFLYNSQSHKTSTNGIIPNTIDENKTSSKDTKDTYIDILSDYNYNNYLNSSYTPYSATSNKTGRRLTDIEMNNLQKVEESYDDFIMNQKGLDPNLSKFLESTKTDIDKNISVYAESIKFYQNQIFNYDHIRANGLVLTFLAMFSKASCLAQWAMWRDLLLIYSFSCVLSFCLFEVLDDKFGTKSAKAHTELEDFVNYLHTMVTFVLSYVACNYIFCFCFFCVSTFLFFLSYFIFPRFSFVVGASSCYIFSCVYNYNVLFTLWLLWYFDKIDILGY